MRVWASAMRHKILVLALMALGGVVAALTSCSQTPISVPVRTFERAEAMDVVCMRVRREDPAQPGVLVATTPEPAPLARCAGVPAGVNGDLYAYHLYALVTQTTRGEVAIVDLTGGRVVDIDRASPGINFVPVGELPTDVAVAPDGELAFVGSREVYKPAVYALPTREIFGDALDLPAGEATGVAPITHFPVCSLPQAPGQLAVLPRKTPPSNPPVPAPDGGVDGGMDAGEPGSNAASELDYLVAVVLPGDEYHGARLVTLDPNPFRRAAGLDSTPGAIVGRGALDPCPIVSSVPLSGAGALGGAQVAWDDGIPYADAGLPRLGPPPGASCAQAADAGAGSPPASTSSPRGGPLAVHADKLFVADAALPLIHVFDIAAPESPKELEPLRATRVSDPNRPVAIGAIAVSPPTRDYKQFLYAVDDADGSVMVFDVSDLENGPHVPLTRPHPELNPFQPADRILFSVPAKVIAFARHEFPITKTDDGVPVNVAGVGHLCNPNPNAGVDPGSYRDPGASYRPGSSVQEVDLGPMRLRGIFAFVTLADGQVVVIDVDDWDAPCRRPDPMDAFVTQLAPPQPEPSSSDDLDPYHAPRSYALAATGITTGASLEAFYPISAPHRPRSAFLLRRDPSRGVHIPHLVGNPQLFLADAPVANSGKDAIKNPIMLPTATTLPDPTYVKDPTVPDPSVRELLADPRDPNLSRPGDARAGVRFSWEEPQVHIDQDWTITYEGELPGTDRFSAAIRTEDDHQSASFFFPGALFCARGVEDAAVGRERALQRIQEAQALGIPMPERYEDKVGDYVQIIDELLPASDPYWSAPNACWSDGIQPGQRRDACEAVFGEASAASVQRDFPIIEAYDDRLVVGTYGYPDNDLSRPSRRVIVSRHENNRPFLRLMQCCFHNQARFRVRAGASWLAAGSIVGHLHHVRTSAGGRCAPSCKSEDALLSSRAAALTRTPDPTALTPPGRDSALALRNPAFSLIVWNGADPDNGLSDVPPTRGMTWKFSARGQFAPLVVNLANTTSAVSPQSSKFLPTLGQLAVIDGASQGLVLIDLRTVAPAHAPYF